MPSRKASRNTTSGGHCRRFRRRTATRVRRRRCSRSSNNSSGRCPTRSSTRPAAGRAGRRRQGGDGVADARTGRRPAVAVRRPGRGLCADRRRVRVGAADTEPVETPDTICGGIEVPDPVAGEGTRGNLRDRRRRGRDRRPGRPRGGRDGGPTRGSRDDPERGGGGAWELAERGEFDGDETVVLVNTATGNKEADVLRSYLMSQGVQTIRDSSSTAIGAHIPPHGCYHPDFAR